MSEETLPERLGDADPRDQAYIDSIEDEDLKELVYCTVTTYRRPDRLHVGDPVPALEMTPLEEGPKVALNAARGRPLVLFFGSYT